MYFCNTVVKAWEKKNILINELYQTPSEFKSAAPLRVHNLNPYPPSTPKHPYLPDEMIDPKCLHSFYNIWDFCIWKVRIKFRDMYVLTNDNPYFASYIKFNNLCQYYQPPNVIFFYFSKNSRGFLRLLILSSIILILNSSYV